MNINWGCRSFLTPYVDENGKSKYYGRYNQGKQVPQRIGDMRLQAGEPRNWVFCS